MTNVSCATNQKRSLFISDNPVYHLSESENNRKIKLLYNIKNSCNIYVIPMLNLLEL